MNAKNHFYKKTLKNLKLHLDSPSLTTKTKSIFRSSNRTAFSPFSLTILSDRRKNSTGICYPRKGQHDLPEIEYRFEKIDPNFSPQKVQKRIMNTVLNSVRLRKTSPKIIHKDSNFSSSSRRTGSEKSEDAADKINIIVPRLSRGDYALLKNIDIEDVYHKESISPDVQFTLKRELFKANNKVNMRRNITPITRKSQILNTLSPRKRGIRMSVDYIPFTNQEHKKSKEKDNILRRNNATRMHELNLVSKFYLSSQDPILQVNSEGKHLGVINDCRIMSEFLLSNLSKI